LTDCSRQESKPDVIYADIQQSSKPASENGELYTNATATNDFQLPEPVIYSEVLQNEDTAAHTVEPSDNLYANVAEVQKR